MEEEAIYRVLRALARKTVAIVGDGQKPLQGELSHFVTDVNTDNKTTYYKVEIKIAVPHAK